MKFKCQQARLAGNKISNTVTIIGIEIASCFLDKVEGGRERERERDRGREEFFVCLIQDSFTDIGTVTSRVVERIGVPREKH